MIEITEKSFSTFKTNYANKFGMVILGAGGNLNEWVEGIGNLLLEQKLVEIAPIFSEAFKLTGNVLGNEGRTDLALIFDKNTKVNIGKLAMWRISVGSCSWIDDFIVNYAKDYES